ncbi:ATP-dependent DNA helicase RecG [Tenacibaculum sp. Bg11-29]|uniref:DEAD/DEAH box helicase n=1 Tax=Tenacibaculum sp. Bg11-29 TaxID=2058306 RepID=UPI000C32F96E|nr:DEAD/DEAH box helicase [Tenacibaculum sp. Bg11-29]PKH51132.1 ATP-dependent DNA helicase RecG [Tenacibaculum sp. Bg11-29]
MNLNHPVTYIKGVSVARAELLYTELGVKTCNDLLHLFPFRYIDKTQFYTINKLAQNSSEVQVVGKITGIKEVQQKRGSRVVATFSDATGSIELVWFKGAKWIKDSLKVDVPYVIYGKLNWYNSTASMPHPEMETVKEYKSKLQTSMQPVYPSTEKLANKGISNKILRGFIQNLFQQTFGLIDETLPIYLLNENQLLSKKDALLNIHFPKSQELLAKAQNRLKFEELFFIQIQLLQKKLIRKSKIKGYIFEKVGDHFTNFYNNYLPFELTNAQKRVLKEIRKDIGSGVHMNRLLQGDVGSGKTIVALLTMLLAIDNGYQATIMAPTEILAIQHYNGMVELLAETPLKIALLTGSSKIKQRREIHTGLEDGSLHILIGTHAVLEDKVQFKNLGISIIDEQHRFGVAQRSKLWEKNPVQGVSEEKGKVVREKYMTTHPSEYKLLKEIALKRKNKTTKEERALWEVLSTKQTGFKFRRYYIIDEFMVDFICLEKKLIVEVNGKYYATPEQKEAANLRSTILNEFGYEIIRLSDEEVSGAIENTIARIEAKLKSLPLIKVKKSVPPHVLVMTATPIPRTLAMSVYGDLDISVIDELPPGRKEIKTVHRYDSNRLSVFKFLKDEINKGRQAYVVYPLIQESEAMDYKDLMDGYESISRDFPSPKYQISIVHGQMKPADKEYEMNRFVKGETQIMVATTVIEVGVNVPNASVMVIESAERFGLSQLHQLRGRVGRGGEQSYCILLSSFKLSSDSKTRLQTMVETTDGFKIAEVDLKLRGPGNIMGTQQSGVLNLKIADVVKDSGILQKARQIAISVLEEDAAFSKPENANLLKVYRQLQKTSGLWSNIS